MGFFSRLGNIISGKANKALDSIEKPMEQFENALRKKTEDIKIAKKQVATFYSEIDVQKGKLDSLKAEKEQYKKGAIISAKNGNTEQFNKWKTEENRVDMLIQEQEQVIGKMKTQVELLKEKIKKSEKELNDAKREKEALKARAATADAAAKVTETVMNLDKGSSFSLDDIRETVQKKEGYVNGLDQLKDTSKDELEQLIASSTDVDMEAEMEKYKNMEV